MGFLANKKALIIGIASARSIAWGVAQAMHREGAELALTYQNEKLQSRVEKLASECNAKITLPCDVSNDKQINDLFARLKHDWSHIDIIIHSVAFAPRDHLQGDYVDSVTREGFRIAHDISSYSFCALAKAGREMMRGQNGALLTLSYLGAERTIPNYNVMGVAKASLEANVRYMAASLGSEGIRVNAVSAGPIKTLAASGIDDFNRFLSYSEKNTPLKRNVTIEEVGNTAAFLCSDLASGITGEVVYVDGGYHIVGMANDF
ncbi:enoyl-ACP reductase [Candidatus Nitrosacidococcus sp. I8]|uniref:enoyl-ACP reductase FabI n=1 Tax=Candidatus Nitrosacidococcus sp. I8 TaxID=2942908 RepID=UPI002226C213|nr:enoyl-ACP reductase [Candidatus Nitrosacidococcus sp. I8]CAH9019010.1 Enoyl-[acyl-carrier-protein] reductase [NADH] FabI [Candidatus Nitrosacidococcus sp. I8]